MERDEFLEGYNAYVADCDAMACPYPMGSDERAACTRGWLTAEYEDIE